MKTIDVLRRINFFLANKLSKKISYRRQHDYLYSLSEPEDDIERSYYQYLCQKFSVENSFAFALKNLSSFFLYCYYIHKKYKKEPAAEAKRNPHIYLSVNNKSDMLPDEIRNLNDLIVVPYGENTYLNQDDLSFIRQIKSKYKHHYYFLYKTILKVSLYSAIINKYSPRAIIVNGETSYTSSILTDYCEKRNVKHINVMHGEKLFLIRDSFFRFSECYVWTRYHVDLFKSLRADKSHYIISLPPAMKIGINDTSSSNSEDAMVDYKFYLGYETRKTLKRLKEICSILSDNNLTFRFRPHPVYTDINLLSQYFSNEIIEDARKVSIDKSILSSKNVVSIYSTVLRQAQYAGIRIIIDNCSNPSKFVEIMDLQFWATKEDCKLLSDEFKDILSTRRTRNITPFRNSFL